VTSIGDLAFRNCTSLTSVTIGNGVTSIGYEAFADCTNLTDIIFEGTRAQWSAISRLNGWNKNVPAATATCSDSKAPGLYETGTTNMIMSWDELIENGLIDSEGKAITEQKNNLAGDLVLPNSMTIIANGAFNGCRNLIGVEIPSSVTNIYDESFRDCYALASVTFGEDSRLQRIGGYVFANCTSLTAINIPVSVTVITGEAFYRCTGLTSIVIPYGVTDINSRTFYGCTALTSVVIPASVKRIRLQAFCDCTALTDITFKSTKSRWNSIDKVSSWNTNVPATYVQCSDGTVQL
jgi:hypothetical protein